MKNIIKQYLIKNQENLVKIAITTFNESLTNHKLTDEGYIKFKTKVW